MTTTVLNVAMEFVPASTRGFTTTAAHYVGSVREGSSCLLGTSAAGTSEYNVLSMLRSNAYESVKVDLEANGGYFSMSDVAAYVVSRVGYTDKELEKIGDNEVYVMNYKAKEAAKAEKREAIRKLAIEQLGCEPSYKTWSLCEGNDGSILIETSSREEYRGCRYEKVIRTMKFKPLVATKAQKLAGTKIATYNWDAIRNHLSVLSQYDKRESEKLAAQRTSEAQHEALVKACEGIELPKGIRLTKNGQGNSCLMIEVGSVDDVAAILACNALRSGTGSSMQN